MILHLTVGKYWSDLNWCGIRSCDNLLEIKNVTCALCLTSAYCGFTADVDRLRRQLKESEAVLGQILERERELHKKQQVSHANS